MRPSRRDILIATRRSRLATTQAEWVGRALQRLNPRAQLQLVPLESEGDRVLDHPLASIGGKGLFTRSIERAVLVEGADIAVHSLKDVPADEITSGLVLAAIPKREVVHDVLISTLATNLQDLPPGATLGTCSKRRAAQVLRMRPDLHVIPLRGNIETRMRRVIEERAIDATLLAAAGLRRLGITTPHAHPVPVEQVLPAAGQGALAVQCRVQDHVTVRRCLPINDALSAACVHAERTVVAALGADCHSPIAALAEPVDHQTLRLRTRVLSVDGRACIEDQRTGLITKVKVLCAEAVASLERQGARRLLAMASHAAT